VRSLLRAAVLPLATLLAVLALFPASPAAAQPPTTLLAGAPNVSDGKVTLVVTPRYAHSELDITSIQVTAGKTALPFTAVAGASDAAPRAMVLVVDASSTVTVAVLQDEVEAATAVVGGLPTDVPLGLVVVGPQPARQVTPTTDRNAVTSVLSGLTPGGSRDLVDRVDVARNLLGNQSGAERRLMIIGAGTDAASATSAQAEGALLVQSGDVTDAIVANPDATVIKNLATPTGGTITAADTGYATAARQHGTVLAAAVEVTIAVPASLAGTSTQLAVSVKGTNLTTTVAVTFGGTRVTGPVASGPVSSALSWVPAWLGWAFGVLFFAALLIAVLSVAWPRSFKHERMRQIASFGPNARNPATRQSTDAPVPSVIARTALAATASVVRSGKLEERIARRLERAGMRMRAHEWVLLRVCIVVACGAVLSIWTGLVGALIGALIGFASTLLYQSVRTDRRTNQFVEQLPDALQLVIGSLKSGFSLPQALDSLVRESPDPVASEFGRALSEHRLGVDISDALERVAQRTQSEDLGWTVMAVRIQREVGGNLAEVLQTTVDTMRERGRLRRHVRSLSAEGRLSAYVLIGLPIALGLFMFIFRRSYMIPLVTDPLGIIMLSVGGLLFILGIFWMTRVVKVEA
jgi:tight adherence protein B